MSKRGESGPPRLSAGERWLRLLCADISNGRIVPTTTAGMRRLEQLVAVAHKIMDGEDPGTALRMEYRAGAAPVYWRDRHIAMYIHSERKHHRRKWPAVTANINRWVSMSTPYKKVLPQATLKDIYNAHKQHVEEWDLCLPGLSEQSDS